MTDDADVNELHVRPKLLAYADAAVTGIEADHREIARRARTRSASRVPLGGLVVALLVVGVVVLVARVPIINPGSRLDRASASSCADGVWPATAITCDTAFRIGSQAGAQVGRARIWLTTLGAVKASMHPTRQVSEPAEAAEVWVIVYDGFWRCCPNAFDENGNKIPQVDQTRWLVVAEAAREGTGFINLQDWSGKAVPELLPLPPRSPSSSKAPLRLPAVAAGEPCPVSQPTTPGNGQASWLGDGPVRLVVASSGGAVFFETTVGGPWKAIDAIWTAAPDFTGEVLLRGARLDGTDELGFGDPANPATERQIVAERGQAPGIDGRLVLATTMIRVKVAGCYGLQIDTEGLSSIVVFEAKPIEDAFSQLERPVLLPAAGSAGCPVTSTTGSVPFIPVTLGDGPVYLAGGSRESIANSAQTGGYWFIKAIWIANPEESGPILVRGGRIDAPGDLRFGDRSDPAGDLRLPIHSYEHTGGQPPGWRIFNAYLRPPSPGCYAVQLDTFSGSRWLVFDVSL